MSNAMDAAVVLALATKAERVFAQDDTMISFPLAPVAYRRDALAAMIAGQTAEGLRQLAEFSRLVNLVPTGAVWAPVGDRYVWDSYGDVLWNAELATQTLTPAQQDKYRKAAALLHVDGPDGLLTDSPAMVSYRQRRDAWLVAQQEYNNRKGTAEQSTDPAVKSRWTADEPLLRAQVEDAERSWAVQGRRAEIEEAQRIERQFVDGSPAGMWGSYRKAFDLSTPEVLFSTDPQGGRYVATSLQPTNALDVPWSRITVDEGELTSLAQAAPAALRARLPAAGATNVVSVSFEYTSVTVQRPWMNSAVFGSRAWRYGDPTKVLSDGKRPEPQGTCPSYVVALVLARNVTVTSRTSVSAPAASAVNIGFLPVAQPVMRATTAKVMVSPALMKPAVIARPEALTARAATLRPRRPIEDIEVVHEPEPVPTAEVVRLPPSLLARLRAENFKRVAPVAPTPPPPTPPTGSNSSTTPHDELYVLGFICKRVPKAPDPDPAFTWE